MTQLTGLYAAVTALLLAWSVFAGGRIAQLRTAPRYFRAVSGLCGLLAIPAILVGIAGQSELTGRALGALTWLWPAVTGLFAAQAAIALRHKLVSPFIGVPLVLYNLLEFLIASTRVASAGGMEFPVFAMAPGAAQATLLSLVLGISSIGSPLALAIPLLSPAGRARWRPSILFRSSLALYAAAAVALVAVKTVSTYRALEVLQLTGDGRITERANSPFEVAVRILPALTAAPGALPLAEDFALADSMGVGALHVRVSPEGATAAALDSLARALDPYRRDSVLLIVTLGEGRGAAADLRKSPGRFLERRMSDVDQIIRRLRPDFIVPADAPFAGEAEAIGRQSAAWWEEYYSRVAEVVRHDRPATRILVALAASGDSVLYAWAAAGGSPVDGIAFVLSPSADGRAPMAALVTADRWIGSTVRDNWTHWVFATGAPSLTGEEAQLRLLHHVLAWASARQTVQGVVLGDAGDYDRITGFRAANGRFRAVMQDAAAAIRILNETPATIPP